MKKKNRFEFTIEGNRKAQEYLKSVGQFTGRVKASDGYNQVHYANELTKKYKDGTGGN